jgi:hypothetical protein
MDDASSATREEFFDSPDVQSVLLRFEDEAAPYTWASRKLFGHPLVAACAGFVGNSTVARPSDAEQVATAARKETHPRGRALEFGKRAFSAASLGTECAEAILSNAFATLVVMNESDVAAVSPSLALQLDAANQVLLLSDVRIPASVILAQCHTARAEAACSVGLWRDALQSCRRGLDILVAGSSLPAGDLPHTSTLWEREEHGPFTESVDELLQPPEHPQSLSVQGAQVDPLSWSAAASIRVLWNCFVRAAAVPDFWPSRESEDVASGSHEADGETEEERTWREEAVRVCSNWEVGKVSVWTLLWEIGQASETFLSQSRKESSERGKACFQLLSVRMVRIAIDLATNLVPGEPPIPEPSETAPSRVATPRWKAIASRFCPCELPITWVAGWDQILSSLRRVGKVDSLALSKRCSNLLKLAHPGLWSTLDDLQLAVSAGGMGEPWAVDVRSIQQCLSSNPLITARRTSGRRIDPVALAVLTCLFKDVDGGTGEVSAAMLRRAIRDDPRGRHCHWSARLCEELLVRASQAVLVSSRGRATAQVALEVLRGAGEREKGISARSSTDADRLSWEEAIILASNSGATVTSEESALGEPFDAASDWWAHQRPTGGLSVKVSREIACSLLRSLVRSALALGFGQLPDVSPPLEDVEGQSAQWTEEVIRPVEALDIAEKAAKMAGELIEAGRMGGSPPSLQVCLNQASLAGIKARAGLATVWKMCTEQRDLTPSDAWEERSPRAWYACACWLWLALDRCEAAIQEAVNAFSKGSSSCVEAYLSKFGVLVTAWTMREQWLKSGWVELVAESPEGIPSDIARAAKLWWENSHTLPAQLRMASARATDSLAACNLTAGVLVIGPSAPDDDEASAALVTLGDVPESAKTEPSWVMSMLGMGRRYASGAMEEDPASWEPAFRPEWFSIGGLAPSGLCCVAGRYDTVSLSPHPCVADHVPTKSASEETAPAASTSLRAQVGKPHVTSVGSLAADDEAYMSGTARDGMLDSSSPNHHDDNHDEPPESLHSDLPPSIVAVDNEGVPPPASAISEADDVATEEQKLVSPHERPEAKPLDSQYGGGTVVPAKPSQRGRVFDPSRRPATALKHPKRRSRRSKAAAAEIDTPMEPVSLDEWVFPNQEGAFAFLHAWRPWPVGSGCALAVSKLWPAVSADAGSSGRVVQSFVAESIARHLLLSTDFSRTAEAWDAVLVGTDLEVVSEAESTMLGAAQSCLSEAKSLCSIVPTSGLVQGHGVEAGGGLVLEAEWVVPKIGEALALVTSAARLILRCLRLQHHPSVRVDGTIPLPLYDAANDLVLLLLDKGISAGIILEGLGISPGVFGDTSCAKIALACLAAMQSSSAATENHVEAAAAMRLIRPHLADPEGEEGEPSHMNRHGLPMHSEELLRTSSLREEQERITALVSVAASIVCANEMLS